MLGFLPSSLPTLMSLWTFSTHILWTDLDGGLCASQNWEHYHSWVAPSWTRFHHRLYFSYQWVRACFFFFNMKRQIRTLLAICCPLWFWKNCCLCTCDSYSTYSVKETKYHSVSRILVLNSTVIIDIPSVCVINIPRHSFRSSVMFGMSMCMLKLIYSLS